MTKNLNSLSNLKFKTPIKFIQIFQIEAQPIKQEDINYNKLIMIKGLHPKTLKSQFTYIPSIHIYPETCIFQPNGNGTPIHVFASFKLGC